MTVAGGGAVVPVAVGDGAVDVDPGAGGWLDEAPGAGSGSEADEQPGAKAASPEPKARTARRETQGEREIIEGPIRAVGKLTVTQA